MKSDANRVRLATSVFSLLLMVTSAFSIGSKPIVDFSKRAGDFTVVENGESARILTDAGDYPGVLHAAHDLADDVARVTGVKPLILNLDRPAGAEPIILGTIGKNRVIDRLIQEGKLDASKIAGKWESFLIQSIKDPLPGVASGLVIAGSDKRGTIYGAYELSEQMGVSPWYWWADVPVVHRPNLFVRPDRFLQGPPAVKYRGIFLNDEAPSLSGWVSQHYGTYNHEFYVRVFELLLRLRANYLWPAMWNNCFSEDDPLNPKLADEYGIVMGTSHVEPMMRADKEWNRKGYSEREWNYSTHPKELESFWTEGVERNKAYENVVTIGMRGKIDTPMSESANISLLEQVVAAQRKILAEHVNPDVTQVPQLWCLYKEVQEYYEKGMRVPDDVTLLWSDDNWGDIRRLPTPEEQRRAGGAGVYYHFDYVGGPRNYKWINTNPIPKVWEQMNLAYEHGADRIWIVNVGDLKPMEFPMEFFLTFARDPKKWPKERLEEFTRLWAAREFGPAHAVEIAQIVETTLRLNGRRKPELLEPGTYSLTNYEEADRLVNDFHALVERAERINQTLPADARDAFFELVLHPAKSAAIVNELYVAAAKNALYAGQGRASTNDMAASVLTLFQADADLTKQYHSVAGGKWNHMMDQTHIGYTYWQQPEVNVMPKVQEIDLPPVGIMGITVEGARNAWPEARSGPPIPFMLGFDPYGKAVRYIDVFNRGSEPFTFTATTSTPLLRLSSHSGKVDKESRLLVSVNWDKVPEGSSTGSITISGPHKDSYEVWVSMFKPNQVQAASFYEGDRYVSIEPEHFTRRISAHGVSWERIPGYGNTLSGMTPTPCTAASLLPPVGSPCLEYTMYLFSGGLINVESIFGPSLAFTPGRGLRFAVSFDNEQPQVVDIAPRYLAPEWETAVKDNARKVNTSHRLSGPGVHTLKIWMVDPGVVLQKIVVNLGGVGVNTSYLGPPESFRGLGEKH